MNLIKESIISTYDDAMKNYLESDEKKSAEWELSNAYMKYRTELQEANPELAHKFDELMTSYEFISQKEKEEAYYRGVIIGIAEGDQLKNK